MERPEQAGASDGARAKRVREAKLALKRAERERKAYTRHQVRRFRAPARRRLARWGVVVGAVALVATLVAVVLYSPLLEVRRVSFEGLDRTDEAALEDALSWVPGQNLARLDQDRVVSDLGEFPGIQSVSLTARLPGTLVVTVLERTPVGVVKDGSRFDLMDAAGVTIESYGKRPDDAPLLEVPSTSGEVFETVVAVLADLPDELSGSLDRVTASTRDDVTLYTTDDRTVVWGSDEQDAEKRRVYVALREAKPKASVYDVSAPLTPVVR